MGGRGISLGVDYYSMFPRISRIRAWSHGYRILAQVLTLIPRPDMQSLDNAYGADRARQAPSRWSQFDALICAQLTGRHSLVMSSVPRHAKPKHSPLLDGTMLIERGTQDEALKAKGY